MKVGVALALLAGLAVVASGCGGSSKKAASSTTTATSGAAATTSSSKTSTQSAPTFATAHNCAQLAALGAQVAKSLQVTSGDLQATVANEDKVLQAMANAVPSEVRGDFQTFVGAFHTYVQALEKIGLKAGSTPTAAQIAQLTAAGKAFSSPKLQAAEQHLSAWASKNCGGVTTTTS